MAYRISEGKIEGARYRMLDCLTDSYDRNIVFKNSDKKHIRLVNRLIKNI